MSDDVIGAALLDFYNNNYSTDIIVKSSITSDDIIPVPYLFRSEEELPDIEKKALEFCKGSVLDVGAGSGCHSILLQQKKINVAAIDTSEGAVEVMKARGLNAEKNNFFDSIGNYDTLLFLMNGIGISGTIEGLKSFLLKAKSLMNDGGQILLNSSDISYMFKEEDGYMWVNLKTSYYGEVVYQMEYKNLVSEKFNWLFVDFSTLEAIASEFGFKAKIVLEGESNDYLAQLTI